jgi:DNA topoisomerase-3
MSKALIIAEKPSVAADIARVIGGFSKKVDFYESDTYVLSSAVGHLLEICPPENCEVKRGKWNLANLPVIPPSFALRPIIKSESRLKLLLRLIRRKDVGSLINACDAGREGELIFRYIVKFAETAKPIRRLWLQSMTAGSIRDGFAALREDAEMLPLAEAAICRSEADWLVGINSTRAMTAFNSKLGGFHLTTVGRVQTPTLAIIVEREELIRKFVSRDFWEVRATFQAVAGAYTGRWFDEAFAKDKNGDVDLKAERLWEQARAEAIRVRCLGKPGIVSEESKPTSQLSPLLFDLTSLQREANGRFGFSARRTLQLAQSLYERHKALTYPRTDARALPEDYVGMVIETIKTLAAAGFGPTAAPILAQGWVRPNKRIFNNAKISDHFAIIPTAVEPKALHDDERKIYDMVTRRFLAVFYPAAEFLVTMRITRVGEDPFKSEGKVLINPGWLAVYGKESQADDAPRLVAVQAGETVQTIAIDLVSEKTKPPARFTEATLLSAMEGAGKLVEDEELREAMSAKGLGTPATRAAIIEGLIYEVYIVRRGRELHPTAKAFSLMSLLRGLGIPELCSPELTGDWEFKLKQMERSELHRPDFMREIADMTRRIVEKAKHYEHDTIPGTFGVLKVPCPKCGGSIQENYKKFQCQKCDFSVWKSLAGRQFELEEMETLLSRRSVGPLEHFRSQKGKPFVARVLLSPEFKIEFDFGQGAVGEAAAVVDFTGQETLGTCPVCGGRVFENGRFYVCEKATGPAPTCKFRSGTVILQQIVDRAQMSKLLATGKTDLLTKFISRKNRPFKAFLVNHDGKVEFEFMQSAKAKAAAALKAGVEDKDKPVKQAPEANLESVTAPAVKPEHGKAG